MNATNYAPPSDKDAILRSQNVLVDGILCRVAQRDNRSGCGAKGTLRDNKDGSWTLVSMYKCNQDFAFCANDVAWVGGFADDSADGEEELYNRIQLQ